MDVCVFIFPWWCPRLYKSLEVYRRVAVLLSQKSEVLIQFMLLLGRTSLCLFFFRNAKTHTSEQEEKSDVVTYISIVDFRCCNYYFCIFHDECCMKYSVHVAARILYPRVKWLNVLFWCCNEKISIGRRTLANLFFFLHILPKGSIRVATASHLVPRAW